MRTATKSTNDVEVLEREEKTLVETTERQTIVHCKIVMNAGDGIRIWKSTFLIESDTRKKRKLIHFENITLSPEWTIVEKTGNYKFTLIFEGLGKGCIGFDLKEIIPQPGGFEVSNIARNLTDVYRLQLPSV